MIRRILLLSSVLCSVGLDAVGLEVGCLLRRPAFSLPEVVYAAPGLECNVYFGSSFDTDSPRAYSFDACCAVGRCLNDRWTWTPAAADAGTRHRLVLNAWSDFGPLVSCTVSVEVAKASADRSRKVTFALLGDSLTNARYQDRVLAVMREAGWTGFTPVGSRSGSSSERIGVFRDGEAAHDGYGGFTPTAFLERYAVAVDEIDNLQSEAEKEQLRAFGTKIPAGQEWRRALLKSPLVRLVDGKMTVDVQGWLDRINGGKAPDFLFIELGVNGTCAQREEDLVRYCEEVQVADMRKLVGKIRAVAPDTVIAIGSCLVGADQDSYGRNYGCSISARQSHRNMFCLSTRWKALVEDLKAAGDDKVFYVPFGNVVDPVYGYIPETVPAFVHSQDKVRRICNAVHPSLVGGKQLGDAIAAFLMVSLSK